MVGINLILHMEGFLCCLTDVGKAELGIRLLPYLAELLDDPKTINVLEEPNLVSHSPFIGEVVLEGFPADERLMEFDSQQ